MFDSTAVTYDDQINKLLGVSDCNSTPEENSARFGWKWNTDCIEIYAYVHNNGETNWYRILDINLNEWHNYILIIDNDTYTFDVDGYGVVVERTKKCNKGVYTLLQPYYGGEKPAPHDIYIYIIF